MIYRLHYEGVSQEDRHNNLMLLPVQPEGMRSLGHSSESIPESGAGPARLGSEYGPLGASSNPDDCMAIIDVMRSYLTSTAGILKPGAPGAVAAPSHKDEPNPVERNATGKEQPSPETGACPSLHVERIFTNPDISLGAIDCVTFISR